jgi:hypothetical protein
MLVDQRYNTMQRNQNFVEAEGEAEAEEEEVEEEQPVLGGPYNINRMRPLRGEQRLRFLNEWICHEVRQEVRREMGKQAEVEAEAEAEQVPEVVRPTRNPSGNWQCLAGHDPFQNWRRLAPNDIRCPHFLIS